MVCSVCHYIRSLPSETIKERAKKVAIITLLVVAALGLALAITAIIGSIACADGPAQYFKDLGQHLGDNALSYGLGGGGLTAFLAVFYIFYPQKSKSRPSPKEDREVREVGGDARASAVTPTDEHMSIIINCKPYTSQITPPPKLIEALGGQEVYNTLPEVKISDENVKDLRFHRAEKITHPIMKGSFIARGYLVHFIVITYRKTGARYNLQAILYPREFTIGQQGTSSCWNFVGDNPLTEPKEYWDRSCYILEKQGYQSILDLCKGAHPTCRLASFPAAQ